MSVSVCCYTVVGFKCRISDFATITPPSCEHTRDFMNNGRFCSKCGKKINKGFIDAGMESFEKDALTFLYPYEDYDEDSEVLVGFITSKTDTFTRIPTLIELESSKLQVLTDFRTKHNIQQYISNYSFLYYK